MTRLLIGALAAALNIPNAASSPAPAPVGPPWISIEYPVNPYDQTTRDAFLVVHAFHHGTPMAFPVSGTAEGIVNGQRRTITLDFGTTSRTGAYALKKQWPDQGTWTLVIGVMQGPEDRVTRDRRPVERRPGGTRSMCRRERRGYVDRAGEGGDGGCRGWTEGESEITDAEW